MYKLYFLSLLVLLVSVQAAEIDSTTTVTSEWAINTKDGSGQKLEFTLEPKLTTRFDNDIKFTALGRLRLETLDKLMPRQAEQDTYSPASQPALFGDHAEIALREFYLETELGPNYLTLGKQQIVWGKADGLKVLDIVNPQSFREFILDDFEDSRIPLWAVNLEIPLDGADLQLLWIPDQTYDQLPELDGTYAFTSSRFVPTAPPGVLVERKSVDKPNRVLADSDFGLRLSAFWQGWDVSLNYLYHYHDQQVFYRQLDLSGTQPKVILTPRYERSHLLGGTFSNAFGDLTLRGELGYSFNRYFLTEDSHDSDGVIKRDELSYVLGFDWYGFTESLVSVQLFESRIINAPSQLTRPNTDTNVSLLIRREFLNDSLEIELLWLHNLNDEDGLARPKLTYEWQDDLKTWIGVDIFYGDNNGLFGQFDETDRMHLGMEMAF